MIRQLTSERIKPQNGPSALLPETVGRLRNIEKSVAVSPSRNQDRNTMKKAKVHSLTGRITYPLMLQAFKAVKRNRGAAGVDKQSVVLFEKNLEENLLSLMHDLKTRGLFKPKPLRRVHIPKGPPGSNQTRPLGIPVVRDRIAQQVLRSLLEPIFEPLFHEDSYGFRPNRNCHKAIERALKSHGEGFLHVLDADIKGFFDNIPHEVIMQRVAKEVADGNILGILQRFLTAGVMEDGVFKPTTVGTPQGGVISPLLANIVLNPLDWALQAAGFRFVRYADDFIVLCPNANRAQEARLLVEQTLNGLGLTLSPEKTKVTTYRKGYEFLGFFLSSRSRRMRDKSVRKFKDKVRELTRRSHNLDARVIVKLNRVIRGTANYFATPFATMVGRFQKLDSWVRMRLRAMELKRKNYNDNYKLRCNYFARKLGLLTMEEISIKRKLMATLGN